MDRRAIVAGAFHAREGLRALADFAAHPERHDDGPFEAFGLQARQELHGVAAVVFERDGLFQRRDEAAHPSPQRQPGALGPQGARPQTFQRGGRRTDGLQAGGERRFAQDHVHITAERAAVITRRQVPRRRGAAGHVDREFFA